jgi:hypothetical protein
MTEIEKGFKSDKVKLERNLTKTQSQLEDLTKMDYGSQIT